MVRCIHDWGFFICFSEFSAKSQAMQISNRHWRIFDFYYYLCEVIMRARARFSLPGLENLLFIFCSFIPSLWVSLKQWLHLLIVAHIICINESVAACARPINECCVHLRLDWQSRYFIDAFQIGRKCNEIIFFPSEFLLLFGFMIANGESS